MVTINRFNIFAKNSDDIETLVIGHIDTVQPSKSWTKNPIIPEIIKDNLYGLGSTDMKSGIAVMLQTAISKKLKPNIAFLFYIDEEYKFIGIKKFIDNYSNKLKPKQIISLDGLELSICNGCRGLIKLNIIVKGKSAHAATPKEGINAITQTYLLIQNLINWINKFNKSRLGQSSTNIAYINGGQYKELDSNNNLILGKQGNIIPDICQFVLEIRPNNTNINGNSVSKFIKNQCQQLNLVIYEIKICEDYKQWFTPKNRLFYLNNLNLDYKKIDTTGFIDIQMLWEKFNKIPCFTIGAGEQSKAHSSDEYINIQKLIKLQEIVNQILTIN